MDFAGKVVTLRSANGPSTCVIDCENDGRGFFLQNEETKLSVVEGFGMLERLLVDWDSADNGLIAEVRCSIWRGSVTHSLPSLD